MTTRRYSPIGLRTTGDDTLCTSSDYGHPASGFAESNLYRDGRGILLALDRTLEQHLRERSDGSFNTAPPPPVFTLAGYDLKVSNVEIEFRSEAIDATSFSDTAHVSVPGRRYTTFKIEGYGVVSADMLDHPLAIDQVFGEKRIRASLRVTNILGYHDAGTFARYCIDAVSEGEVQVTDVATNTPIQRIELPNVRRGIRLE